MTQPATLPVVLSRLLIAAAMSFAASGDAQSSASVGIEKIRQNLQAGTADHVRIYILPYTVNSSIRVTSKALRSSAALFCELRPSASERKELSSLLDRIFVGRSNEGVDLRLGIDFLTKTERAIGSIDLAADRKGQLTVGAKLNGDETKVTADLNHWVKANFRRFSCAKKWTQIPEPLWD